MESIESMAGMAMECIRAGGSRKELSFYGLPGAMTPHGWQKNYENQKKEKKNIKVAEIGFSAYERGF
jgi:hypothetical protein